MKTRARRDPGSGFFVEGRDVIDHELAAELDALMAA